MATKTIDGVIGYTSGTEVATNYIKQINDGSTTHDIAVQSGITFFNGLEGQGVVWDGTQPLEVVIPTLADIVSNPVRLVGTVGVNGNPPANPTTGDLVYITADCTFQDGSQDGIACEAGDMAIYDGSNWHVISGENQVTLAGGTIDASGNHSVAISGTAVKVLDVEGKGLSLAIDYDDVRSKVSYSTNLSADLEVAGKVNVVAMSIALSQADGSKQDITTSVSIDLPTKIASDAVTIDSVLQASDFTFTSGSFPTITKSSDFVSVSTSHNLEVSLSGDGDFVTAISAIKKAELVAGTSDDKQIAFGIALAAATGTSFVTGAHSFVSGTDEGKAVAFNLWGEVSVSTSSFVSGLDAASASGDLVSSITGAKGAVSLDSNGSGILTGLTEGSDVVTSVSFGSLVEDANSAWFYSGLSASANGSVVTGVDFGSIAFTLSNDSTYAGQAVTTASVNNHVLSFTTASFMKPVTASFSGNSVSKADFTKTGVKLSNDWTYASSGLASASLTQADVTISYRSLLSADLGLAQSSASYIWDTAQDHAYSLTMGYAKISTEAATTTKSGVVIAGDVTASIAAGTAITAVGLSNDGVLPSLSIGEATGEISGQLVSTSLTTSSVSWLAVASAYKEIDIAGAYTLVSDSSKAGAIAVAAPSTYNVGEGNVTIAADLFVTDILVDGSSVKPSI